MLAEQLRHAQETKNKVVTGFINTKKARDVAQFTMPYYLAYKSRRWIGGEQREKLSQLVDKIREGKQTPPSEQMDLISGYEVRTAGIEHLESLKGQPFVVISNHDTAAPFAYFSFVILINNYIKEATKQEVQWVQGSGSSITSFFRENIVKSGNTIPVGNGMNGSKEILRAFETKKTDASEGNKAVGIYPEGETSKNRDQLREGNSRAGRVLLRAAEKEIPIVCVATWFTNGTFFLNIGEPFSLEEIDKRGKSSDDKRKSGQAAINYCMENLAHLMPFRLRGYYNYVHPNSM